MATESTGVAGLRSLSTEGSISVALCTYNGERYLAAQLQSILQQTRLPDEAIIGDDGSSDSTQVLLNAFAAQAPFPVTLLRAGEGRLGSTKNFERAIRHCRGDLIALADQDDVWEPMRLARLSSVLKEQPSVSLVFSDAEQIDENGNTLAGSLWQSFGFSGEQCRRFQSGDYSLLCRERFITGATVMLRRSALANALPIPSVWMHDAWLGCTLSFAGDIAALNERLIKYRVHAQQQVGAGVSRWRRLATRQAAAHWERIHHERLQLDTLLEFLSEHPPSVRAHLLPRYQARAEFLRDRDRLPGTRLARVAPILRHWQEYRQQASGLPSASKDLLFPKIRSKQ